MSQDEVLKLLEEVPSPIIQIELKLGMPRSTLQKVINGERVLPKQWALKLKHFVETKQYITVKRKSKKTGVTDLNEQTNQVKDFSKKPPKTNFTIDTTKKEEPKKELTFHQKLLNKKMGIKD